MATSKHTHALPQCSHASVGLTQAHPNYKVLMLRYAPCNYVQPTRVYYYTMFKGCLHTDVHPYMVVCMQEW